MIRQAGNLPKRQVDGRLLHIHASGPFDHGWNAVPAIAGAHFQHGYVIGRDNGVEVERPAAIAQGVANGLDVLDDTRLIRLRDIGRQAVPGDHEAAQMLVGNGDEGDTAVHKDGIATDFGAVDELATVWVNGKKVGGHNEPPDLGWDKPFTVDVTNGSTTAVEDLTVSVYGFIRKRPHVAHSY